MFFETILRYTELIKFFYLFRDIPIENDFRGAHRIKNCTKWPIKKINSQRKFDSLIYQSFQKSLKVYIYAARSSQHRINSNVFSENTRKISRRKLQYSIFPATYTSNLLPPIHVPLTTPSSNKRESSPKHPSHPVNNDIIKTSSRNLTRQLIPRSHPSRRQRRHVCLMNRKTRLASSALISREFISSRLLLLLPPLVLPIFSPTNLDDEDTYVG